MSSNTQKALLVMICQKTKSFVTPLYNIQIIGEAAYKLTNEFREDHAEVEWRDIITMRHILVHDYYVVNIQILWNVITEELPAFRKQVVAFIEGME